MAARLGRVLYWLGCAISIFVFVGTMVFVNAVADGKPNASEYVFIAFCTAVPWVIGRALRYILAGEQPPMTESERIETLIERLKSRKGSYQWGQKIQQWLHVEERDLIVKALEHYKLSINGQSTD